MIVYILATIIVVLLTYSYLINRRKLCYWDHKGVKTAPNVIPFIGHQFQLMIKPSKWLYIDANYKKFKTDGMWGMYEVGQLNLHITDLDMIKDVLVKEADHFIDRRKFPTNDKYFEEFLTFLEGDRWKAVRSILSPTFSSGKIKGMFDIVHNKAKDLVTRSKTEMKEEGFVDGKTVVSLFTMDVIAHCAFGLDVKSLLDKKSVSSRFMKSAYNVMSISYSAIFKFILLAILPEKLSSALGITVADSNRDYLTNLLSEAYEERVKSGLRRGDYLDLLIETKQKNDYAGNAKKCEFTMTTIISQALLFLLAGFDTTSNAISFIVYNLVKNRIEQEKLREVLNKILESDGEFSYQNIMECDYLDAVVNESLRIFPVAPLLERRCVQEFKVKNRDLTIEKGTLVSIPAYSIHRDSQYWQDPEKFKPERFLPENKDEIIPFTYMPFGHGPRNCIAMRFALMEMKICIAELCTQFFMNIKPGCEKLTFEHATAGLMKPSTESLKVEFTPINI